MNILVTGGAGYIGSHAVRQLLAAGERVAVVDQLSRGNRAAVGATIPFYQVDIHDRTAIEAILHEHAIDCVMHFAALAYVGESVEQPLPYYSNNVCGTLALLTAMEAVGVRKLVFSSTCATYGLPERLPLDEDCRQQPINPYGWSKWMIERVLFDYLHATPDFGYVALRYFNVAGCTPDGTLGEDHRPETHLIPRLLLAALGKLDRVTILGDDYPTPDGTCIRDYIHVDDVCAAHVLAAKHVTSGAGRAFNLALGRGYSVREVIAACERVTGRTIPIAFGPRRPGDPPALFASARQITSAWGWQPRHVELDEIIATAWRWFQRHPDGYGG